MIFPSYSSLTATVRHPSKASATARAGVLHILCAQCAHSGEGWRWVLVFVAICTFVVGGVQLFCG